MKIHRIFKLLTAVLPRLANKDIYFLFPFYHLGGAETVHRDIMEVFGQDRTVCLITNQSQDTLNRSAFSAVTTVVPIDQIIARKKERKIALSLVARAINRNAPAVVFGCNSHFFYDLIPLLNDNITIIDLIHAFSYEEPHAAEKYSLEKVSRIDKRVILGRHAYADFLKLYNENGIDPKLMDRLTIIRNKVNVPASFPDKPANTRLKILFVGRDGYEKRPELFFEIARCADESNLPCDFFVIGFNTDRDLPKNTTVLGPLAKKELDRCYRESDLLLITSSREGFPMVVLEGMAFGVVPICTDVGEIGAFVNAGRQNGFVIANTASTERIVAEFISQITTLASNRPLLSETARNAYQSVKTDFDGKTFTEHYRQLFSIKK